MHFDSILPIQSDLGILIMTANLFREVTKSTTYLQDQINPCKISLPSVFYHPFPPLSPCHSLRRTHPYPLPLSSTPHPRNEMNGGGGATTNGE